MNGELIAISKWLGAHWLFVFWAAVSILYLFLAVASLLSSCRYARKMAKAQPEWMDESGVRTMGKGPGAGDVAVFEYWRDLGEYLNCATKINVVGFLLAAAAALVSYRVLH